MLNLGLKLIGFATVVAFTLTAIKFLWDTFVSPLKCEHSYKIKLIGEFPQSLFMTLKCDKCGKEKDIVISEKIAITKREGDK